MNYNNQLRCPITFVGDKIENDQELNTMFLQPYEIGLISSMHHLEVEDSIRNSCNKEELMDRGPRFTAGMLDVLNTNIMSYLVMNITDLTINTVLRFVQKEFSNNPENVVLFNGGVDQEYIRHQVVAAVSDALDVSNTVSGGMVSNQESLIADYEKGMDIVYARLVALVFDTLITGSVENHYKNGAIVPLYKMLYKDCYGNDNNIDSKIGDPAFMYTFVTSCLREDMSNMLIEYRKALSMIAATAGTMKAGSIIEYCNPANYLNPEYNRTNIYNTIPEMNMVNTISETERAIAANGKELK